MSAKFSKLAAEVHSTKLAGWITNHEPAVRARAMATRAAHNGIKKAGGKKGKR
jgi:hypothetical protein